MALPISEIAAPRTNKEYAMEHIVKIRANEFCGVMMIRRLWCFALAIDAIV